MTDKSQQPTPPPPPPAPTPDERRGRHHGHPGGQQATTDAAARPTPSAAELSAEVLRARAELAATIDELSARLHPKNIAAEAASATKVAAADAAAFITGSGLPAGVPRRARNAKVVLAIATCIATVTVITILRRRGDS